MAHENEYAAAVAGMPEHTPSPSSKPSYAAGDYVSGTSCGKPWSGYIEFFHDNGDVCVNVGGAWLSVPVKDITF